MDKIHSSKEIALIIPYFGTFPEWFDLYLLSCSRNIRVDFYFFTDCEIPGTTYDNTFFIPTTYESYCDRISKILRINFHPTSPYKLCDLKPFYGIIHKDVISHYLFWGFGDIDLIYGDLNTIINHNNLSKYDILTTHTNRIAGHFTIMRASSSYTTACYKIPNWQEKLESQEHLSVDEDDWIKLIYPEVRLLKALWAYVFHPLHIPMKYCFEGPLNKIFCNRITKRSFTEYGTTPIPENGQNWIYNLETGILTNFKGKKIPYLHFLFFKKTPYRDTEIYWKEGFNRTNGIDDMLRGGGYIIINNHGISYSTDL